MSDPQADAKRIEFYAASVAAWYDTSLEYDKSLFVLSAGGIGLLVTLLTTIGIDSSWALGAYVAAIVFFLATIVQLLIIFRRNRRHIEQILGMPGPVVDKTLDRLDLLAMVTFGLGVVFSAIIGVLAAEGSYHSKAKIVADNSKQTNRTMANDSFSGAANLQPSVMQKSFSGAANLQPAASASVSSQPASSAAPTAPASPAAQASAASAPATKP